MARFTTDVTQQSYPPADGNMASLLKWYATTNDSNRTFIFTLTLIYYIKIHIIT